MFWAEFDQFVAGTGQGWAESNGASDINRPYRPGGYYRAGLAAGHALGLGQGAFETQAGNGMARAGANMAGAGVVAIGGTGGAAAEVAVPAVAGGVVLAGAGAAVTAHGVSVVANSGRLLADDIAHFNSADEGSTATQSAATTKSQTDQDVAKEIAVDYNKHPEAAKHIDDAQAAGKPEVVTVDRGNAPSQRAAAQSGQQKVAG